MDTNQVLQLLLNALAQKQALAPVAPPAQTPWLVFALAALSALPAFLAWWTSHDTRKITLKNSAQLETVRVDVNSNATAMRDKLAQSTEKILELSEKVAGMKQEQQGQKIKDAEVAAVAAAASVRPV